MSLVHVEHRGETAVLRFSRPPANAFNLDFVRAFHERLIDLAHMVPPGGVVVTGDGAVFSGGVDFKEVPRYRRAERAEMVSHINAAITLLYGLPAATVAAVNGHAIGGAFVVMLACDTRVAADTDSKLGLTEVTAGIPYPACPIEVVKAEMEPSFRRHLVLSGEVISPRSALDRGLVDELTAPAELLSRATELAQIRSAATSYVRVKEQLKAETLDRLRRIVEQERDPMLETWL